jgi:hypothetical protein
MAKVDLRKKMETIESLVEIFNKSNRTLKRFKIFNTFTFDCAIISDNTIAINVINEEGGSFENTMTLLNESDENFIVSNIENEKEYVWLIKTIDRFSKRTEELLVKARELAKPHVGILVYDEFSDSYMLNSTTGEILLKTKAVVKSISSTKIDLTNVLFNLRKGLTEQEYGDEIIGESKEKILKLVLKISDDINKLSDRLANVERLPRVRVETKVTDTKLTIESYVTDSFGENDHRGKVVNDSFHKFDTESVDSMGMAYDVIRLSETLNEHMKNLGKQLVTRTEPRLFEQQENKKWTLTKEGRDVLDELQIINFINDNIDEVEINIE